MSYVNQDVPTDSKKHICDLCSNPYPYMCSECNCDITSGLIEATAKEMGLDKPKIFIGGGEVIPMWTMEQSCDCA